MRISKRFAGSLKDAPGVSFKVGIQTRTAYGDVKVTIKDFKNGKEAHALYELSRRLKGVKAVSICKYVHGKRGITTQTTWDHKIPGYGIRKEVTTFIFEDGKYIYAK